MIPSDAPENVRRAVEVFGGLREEDQRRVREEIRKSIDKADWVQSGIQFEAVCDPIYLFFLELGLIECSLCIVEIKVVDCFYFTSSIDTSTSTRTALITRSCPETNPFLSQNHIECML